MLPLVVPIIYHHQLTNQTQVAVWLIQEQESFFLDKVPVQAHITHPKKRLQHLAGRYLLQYLYPDFPYEQITIADTKRPFLPKHAIQFSISHTGNYASAIVSKSSQVGVDIEPPTARIFTIVHKFLSSHEQQLIKHYCRIHHADVTIMFTTAWCVKEALYKWLAQANVNFIQSFKIINIQGSIVFCEVHFNNQVIAIQLQFTCNHNLCMVWTIEEAAQFV